MEEETTRGRFGQEAAEEEEKRIPSATIGYGLLGALWLIALIILWPYLVAEPPEVTATIVTPGEPTVDLTAQALLSALPTPTPLPSPTPTPELLLRRPHLVEPGDTLHTIAQQYNSSVALLAIEITALEFTPGNTIEVPVPNPAACPSGRLHVVEQNETLFGLARCYDTSVEALMNANNLGDNVIRVGDVLCLPLP